MQELRTQKPQPVSGKPQRDIEELNRQLSLLIDEAGYRFSLCDMELKRMQEKINALETALMAGD